ncbi:MAG TPA: hypothetical protein VFJ69_08975 [Actinomycetota bacterium]|nr:hypothetical protein [Actinomycetota bacterium]
MVLVNRVWQRLVRNRRQQPNRRQLLLDDAIRVSGYLEAILAMARDEGAPDTVDLATATLFVRMFARKVEIWIEMEDDS